MRYVLLWEGLAFVLVASWLGPSGGVAGVVATSIIFTMLFCFRYSVCRSHRFFEVSRSELVFGWARPCLKLALVFGVLATGLWFLTWGFPPIVRLCIHGTATVIVGGGLFLRVGCTTHMLQEASNRLPPSIARLLRLLAGTSLRTCA